MRLLAGPGLHTSLEQRNDAIRNELAHRQGGLRAFDALAGKDGAADLLVRVACADSEDLFRIDRTILACEGVERTETSLAMGELIPYRIVPLLERGVQPKPS